MKMDELGEWKTVEPPNTRTMLVAVLLVAFVLPGCGDDSLFRIFPEQTAQPGAAPDAGSLTPDVDQTQPEDLEAWYDDQEEIIAPWSHQIDEAAIDDALISDDRISWPLPEYEHMKEWGMNDLLWSPVSDPSRAFLRRVLEIEVTDSQITFYTRNAGLNEVYFKTHIKVDTANQELNSSGALSSEDDLRTRRQGLGNDHLELGPQEFTFGLPKRRFGFCTKGTNEGFKPCQSANTECPNDYPDPKGLCDKREAGIVTGGGVETEPMSAEVSFGTYIEFEPRYQMNIYRLYLVYDIDGYGNENDDECTCITRYYDTDVDIVARRCGMSSDDVVSWKGECAGETTFVNMEVAGGMSIELKDFKWKVNKVTTLSKDFQLFRSLPIPLGGAIGLTLDVKIPLTFNLETLGEMSWENAANGPRIGFDFGFGAIQPAGPRGRFYWLDTPNNNSTSLPAPEVHFGGKASVSAGIEAGALIGFAGAVGAKFTVGGKAEAGVSGGATVSSGAQQGQCVPYFNIGATFDAALVADLGVWERSWTWPIFDTCANPQANMFDLDMRAACLSWGGNNLCNNVFADQVRLVKKNLDGGTYISSTEEWADPDGIEIDAIYAVRGSGDNTEVIRATAVTGATNTPHTIGEADFDQCVHGTGWDSSVTTFGTEMIVTFEEPLQPGDKLHIYRQNFPESLGGQNEDGVVVYCRPSGTFDVFVGDNGQWGDVAGADLAPDKTSHEIGLSLRHFPD